MQHENSSLWTVIKDHWEGLGFLLAAFFLGIKKALDLTDRKSPEDDKYAGMSMRQLLAQIHTEAVQQRAELHTHVELGRKTSGAVEQMATSVAVLTTEVGQIKTQVRSLADRQMQIGDSVARLEGRMER